MQRRQSAPPPPDIKDTPKRWPHLRFVEGFRRADCARCQRPVVALGEAIRVDIAGGGFVIIHQCLPCVRRFGFMPEAQPSERVVGRAA